MIFGRYASGCDAAVAYLVNFWTELQMFVTLLDFPKVFMVQHELINHELILMINFFTLKVSDGFTNSWCHPVQSSDADTKPLNHPDS